MCVCVCVCRSIVCPWELQSCPGKRWKIWRACLHPARTSWAAGFTRTGMGPHRHEKVHSALSQFVIDPNCFKISSKCLDEREHLNTLNWLITGDKAESVCVSKCVPHSCSAPRLIFFGGYGYVAQGPHRGTFEYDESSSFMVSGKMSFPELCTKNVRKTCIFYLSKSM